MNQQKIKDSFKNTWNTFKVIGGDSFVDYVENVSGNEVPLRIYIVLNNFDYSARKFGSCYAYQLLFNNYPFHILEEVSTRYF